MKVLMVTPTYPRWKGDSSARMIHNLSKELAKRNEIHILTEAWPGVPDEETMDGVHIHRIIHGHVGHGKLIHDLNFNRIFKANLLSYYKDFKRAIIKLHHKHNFDILHAHWQVPAGLACSSLKVLLDLPVVVHLRFSILDRQPW